MTPELKPVNEYGDEVVLPHLLSQYRRSLRLIGLIRSGCEGANHLEQALFEIREGFWLRKAVGAQLDILGRVYNLMREGRNDDDYRTQLQFRAASLVNGSPEEVLAFVIFLLSGAAGVEYQPEYPAGYALLTSDTTLPSSGLDALSPSGVRATFAEEMLDALGDPMQDALGRSMYAART